MALKSQVITVERNGETITIDSRRFILLYRMFNDITLIDNYLRETGLDKQYSAVRATVEIDIVDHGKEIKHQIDTLALLMHNDQILFEHILSGYTEAQVIRDIERYRDEKTHVEQKTTDTP